MKSFNQKVRRGRPPSATDGAAEAFDEIKLYKTANGLNNHALALRFNMTPSTVNRALASRTDAAWTPGLLAIYRNVINEMRSYDTTKALLQRLVAYKGPGEAIVKRIIHDVDELLVTLGDRKRPVT